MDSRPTCHVSSGVKLWSTVPRGDVYLPSCAQGPSAQLLRLVLLHLPGIRCASELPDRHGSVSPSAAACPPPRHPLRTRSAVLLLCPDSGVCDLQQGGHLAGTSAVCSW